MTVDGVDRQEQSALAASASNLRWLALALFALLLSLKGDGRFPLPESLGETTFQLLLVPYTLATIATVALFLWPEKALRLSLVARLARRASPRILTLSIALLFSAMALALLPLEARRYAVFGYSLPLAAWGLTAVGVLGVLSWVWLRELRGPLLAPGGLLAALLVVHAVIAVTSMACFPLHSARSDMLPLMDAVGRRVLAGGSPYGWYELAHRLPLTYLPGMWIPFLPGAALGLDPRWTTLAATVATAILLFQAAPPAGRERTAGLVAILVLCPYLLYRHDIYPAVHWVVLAACLLLLTRGRRLPAAACLGFAVAQTQLAWVVAPFLVLHLLRSCRRRAAVGVVALVLAVPAALVLPFVISAPLPFVDGVFGFWRGAFNVTGANLSFWASRLIGVQRLQPLQAVVLLALLAVAARRPFSLAAAWAWMGVALLLFVLLNPVVWVYFYLTVMMLLVGAAVARLSPGGA